jgi:hypothetical protein
MVAHLAAEAGPGGAGFGGFKGGGDFDFSQFQDAFTNGGFGGFDFGDVFGDIFGGGRSHSAAAAISQLILRSHLKSLSLAPTRRSS